MSLWYCRLESGERGPVSFDILAELMADGELREEDLVRRSIASEWEPAGEVIGLRRKARDRTAIRYRGRECGG